MPTFKLNRPQTQYWTATEADICLKGTWGCGKSLVALLKANEECEKHPNNLYLVIRKEWVDLRDSTLKDWEHAIGRKVIGNDVRYENGSVLMFRHGDDINALKNANLGGVLMVQAEEMTEEDFWFLRGRLRRKEGTRQLRLECNYDGKNWIYSLFNIKKTGRLITTNTFDNQENLPPDYIPNLMKLPKKLQERHLYGSDQDMEGQVWDEFSESRHLKDPFDIPKEWYRIVVLDHGVRNPTGVLWGAVDHDGNVFIYDEHYEREKPISYHSEQIKKRDNQNVSDWLADPSIFSRTQQKAGKIYSVADEYQDHDLYFQPANNSVLAGINRVNEYFKSDKLFIFKNCTNTLNEIGGYKWKRLKPGQEKNEPEEPVKHNDHLCDALRYLIMSRPEAPVQKTVISYEKHAEVTFDPFMIEEKTEQIDVGGVEA